MGSLFAEVIPGMSLSTLSQSAYSVFTPNLVDTSNALCQLMIGGLCPPLIGHIAEKKGSDWSMMIVATLR